MRTPKISKHTNSYLELHEAHDLKQCHVADKLPGDLCKLYWCKWDRFAGNLPRHAHYSANVCIHLKLIHYREQHELFININSSSNNSSQVTINPHGFWLPGCVPISCPLSITKPSCSIISRLHTIFSDVSRCNSMNPELQNSTWQNGM